MILTEAIYLPPAIFQGDASLFGGDYLRLHIRRIAFAQSGLFGERHTVPSWLSHELLGAPFSANLQSFPLIPTRLVLLLLDPTVAYSAGVALAAILAAIFTYLYCRRAGLSEIGATAAGWTFACAGYFSTRVAAGHLPLLEAYPALPLLLWLADRAISQERDRYHVRDLLAIAFACACVALAGHPQVPIYSLTGALLYVVARSRGRVRIRVITAMALGLGATLFAWLPMLLLVRRSTRVLALAPPSNDIVMPYRRLVALLRPGLDGWPDLVSLSARHPFSGYPNFAYFWDTASYIGLMPLIAVLFLLIRAFARKRLPEWPWNFLAALGLGALLLALPLTDPLRRIIPGTFLRSPARLLYLSTFAAAAGLGAAVDAVLWSRALRRRAAYTLAAGCLIFHFVDLEGFSRLFIQTGQQPNARIEFDQILSREAGDARVAQDQDLPTVAIDRYDDVGIFDSVLLANPYRAILGLNGSPRDFNTQDLNGAELSVPALQGAGARFVVTTEERTDLKLEAESEEAYLYRVPNPAPRAAFFGNSRVEYMPPDKILDAFVRSARWDRLLLPVEARADASSDTTSDAGAAGEARGEIKYTRVSSDEIRLETSSGEAGFAEVLESYDPGWRAEVDGVRAPVVIANGFSMAVRVGSGRHGVRLRYYTPGRLVGGILTLLSLGGLAGLVGISRRGVARGVPV